VIAVSRSSVLIPVIALLLAVPACDSPGRGPAPGAAATAALDRETRDLVLVTADTLRHDATGFSGAGRVETPLLDRLAGSGAVFDSARAHAVVTLPSHTSILTGRFPYEHGVHDNAGFVLGPGLETLAEILGREGYATAAFVSALPLDRRYGLNRGFDVYDDEYEGYGDGLLQLPERPGSETVARALAWWNVHAGQRRFLWVHLFTPHYPYAPDEPFASRYADAPYFGDVAMMDAELRPLLEPLLEMTEEAPLVVFTSDHGEALGEHGEETHGTFAYDATLKIPLFFWAPGIVPAGRHPEHVWHVDILPTVLDLLGLDRPEGLPGSLLFADGGETPEGYFEALSPYFNRGWAPLTGRMAGDRKAIRLPLAELYDLGNDPGEQRNLAGGQPAAVDELLAGLPPLSEVLAERADVDAETLARLRSLGYVAGNPSLDPQAATDPARDPKNLIELERLLDAAMTHYRQGDTERGVAILREVLEAQPDMPLAHARLAGILVDTGRSDEAIELLVGARKRGVDNESVRRGLALAYLRAGRPEAAREVLGPDRDSADPDTLLVLGRALADSGRHEEARGLFERCLRIDPTFPAARVDLAILTMMEGSFDEARPELEAALSRDPYHAEGWNALGVVRSQGGDPEGAVAAWERAVEIDPRLADALFNLAVARARAGAYPEAIRAMERYSGLVAGAERSRAEEILGQLRRRAVSHR